MKFQFVSRFVDELHHTISSISNETEIHCEFSHGEDGGIRVVHLGELHVASTYYNVKSNLTFSEGVYSTLVRVLSDKVRPAFIESVIISCFYKSILHCMDLCYEGSTNNVERLILEDRITLGNGGTIYFHENDSKENSYNPNFESELCKLFCDLINYCEK